MGSCIAQDPIDDHQAAVTKNKIEITSSNSKSKRFAFAEHENKVVPS